MSWSCFHRRLRQRIKAGDLPDWLKRHTRMQRIIMAAMSTPEWADHKRIAAIHAEARRRSVETGIKHVVDHDIPVCHPLVCGLTIPENLSIVTETHNKRKGNRWHPDQPDLFHIGGLR